MAGEERRDELVDVAGRAARLYQTILGRLEVALERIPAEPTCPGDIGQLVVILRGAELIGRHVRAAREHENPDVAATLAELFRVWDEAAVEDDDGADRVT